MTDTEIIDAMTACFTHLKVVVEPSGACALAAVTFGRVAPAPGRIGVVLSGGNIGWAEFRSLIGHTDMGGHSELPGMRAAEPWQAGAS